MTDPTPTLDLAEPIAVALRAAASIGPNLSIYLGKPAVMTRRPTPAGVVNPFAMVNPTIALGDQDYLNTALPIVQRDVIFYGDQPAHYRLIEALGYAARDLFHRRKWAISPVGYDVIDIVARGPIPGPTDDQQTVARMVGLTVYLRRQS